VTAAGGYNRHWYPAIEQRRLMASPQVMEAQTRENLSCSLLNASARQCLLLTQSGHPRQSYQLDTARFDVRKFTMTGNPNSFSARL
jgi:hypothetical protein